MDIQIVPVTARQELKEFIHLPERLHRQHPLWVPPIYLDERHFFNPDKNQAFAYCDHLMALAKQNQQTVGRIMGIINNKHNALVHEKTARFGFFECIEDQAVAHAMLDYVENWARQKGMTRMVGPMGFTDQDPEGFLVEGFAHEPALATYYNFAYLIDFLNVKGYGKEVDYLVYLLNVLDKAPEVYGKIYQRLVKKGEFTLTNFSKRRELKPFILPIIKLMNELYADFYGYVPLSDSEALTLAKRYLPVLDPRFVKAVRREQQVVAFIIGMPNINAGLRRARGRLFPFGIFKIMQAAKTSKRLDLLLGGIKAPYRGRGLNTMMAVAMLDSARRAGLELIDSHNTLETNTAFHAEMERLGGKVYKRYRIFQKELS
ncbi:MAG: hypothetical protein ALAOOOJD_01889 [bacterium]|nr:hypothetical protein [bacterium]